MEDAGIPQEIILLVSIGTFGILLLIGGIVVFLIKYNNKILKMQVSKQIELIDAEIKGKEAEQTRVARDIHDALGGNLSALNFNLQKVLRNHKGDDELESEINSIKGIVSDTHENIRRVSRDLLANDIEVYGLIYSVTELVKHSTISKGEITEAEGGDQESISLTHKIAIYRVIQEIMNNATKHSHCTEFNVHFDLADGILDISFDGSTFDYEKVKSSSKGLGLKNIESRVQYLNATLRYVVEDGRNHYLIANNG